MPSGGSQDSFVCRRRNEEGRLREALERGDQFGRSFEGFVRVVLVVVRRMHLQGVKCVRAVKGSAVEEGAGALILAQGLEGVVQTRFHCAKRDVHRGGDLSEAEPVHKAEQQDLALLFG